MADASLQQELARKLVAPLASNESRVIHISGDLFPVHLELERGMKGAYKWRAGVKAESPAKAMIIIGEIDAEMSTRYGFSANAPAAKSKAANKEVQDGIRSDV